MYIPLISLCSVNSVYPRAMYSAMLKVREAGVRLVRQLLTYVHTTIYIQARDYARGVRNYLEALMPHISHLFEGMYAT